MNILILQDIQQAFRIFPADGGELISTAEAAEYDNCYKNDNPDVIIKSISQAT